MLQTDSAETNAEREFGAALPRPGELIADKYAIELMIGAGGMGVVYRARQVSTNGHVAVKVLTPKAAQNAEAVVRFVREARAASSIRSKQVVRILDVGKTLGGLPYMAMEYLSGSNLAELVTRRGALPVEQTVDWVLQAGEALAEAHAIGIVHRDLKPSNLFLAKLPDGTSSIKVLDFGISKADWLGCGPMEDFKLTRAAEVLGTPSYMSPEQVRASKDVDSRTDIWSMGVVLFELLSGEAPFVGATFPALCASIASDPPRSLRAIRPEVPEALAHAIDACLQKSPAQRLSTVLELASQIAPFGTQAARESLERITLLSQMELSTMSRRAFSVADAAAIHDELVRGAELVRADLRDTHRTRLLGIAGVLTGLVAALVVIFVVWSFTRPLPVTAQASSAGGSVSVVSSSSVPVMLAATVAAATSSPQVQGAAPVVSSGADAGVAPGKKGAKRRGPLDDRY